MLSGVVVKQPKHTLSPAGIPHCQFVLEHQSEQIEAGLPRRVWCRIKVVASGLELRQQTELLVCGCHVKVRGFISRVEGANGLAQIVLHTTMLKRID